MDRIKDGSAIIMPIGMRIVFADLSMKSHLFKYSKWPRLRSKLGMPAKF